MGRCGVNVIDDMRLLLECKHCGQRWRPQILEEGKSGTVLMNVMSRNNQVRKRVATTILLPVKSGLTCRKKLLLR
jgi:hypothetical protein